ncbi:hypothetical protein YPPY66_2304, partial [Yersinia pestis PY-66]
MFQKEARVAS